MAKEIVKVNSSNQTESKSWHFWEFSFQLNNKALVLSNDLKPATDFLKSMFLMKMTFQYFLIECFYRDQQLFCENLSKTTILILNSFCSTNIFA